jgi:muramidase (phage lysozyme)
MMDDVSSLILGGSAKPLGGKPSGAEPISAEDLSHPNVRKALQYINAYEGKPKANQMFGYKEFNDLSKHPNIKIPFTNKGDVTTAAGTYQILAPTWEAQAKKLNLQDFSPENQEKAAVGILKDTGALDALKAGEFEKAKKLMGTQWASIPGSTIGKSTGQIPKLNEQHEQIFSAGDDVSNLILGTSSAKETAKTDNKQQGFFQELKKPLSEMSYEGFKKESILAPAIEYTAASLNLPGFTEQDKQAAQEKLIAKGKGALKGAEQFIRSPVETAKAIGTQIVENPGKFIGESIKGTVYDPELAVIPASVVTKPIQKGITKAGEVISPAVKGITEQFAKKESTMAGVGAAEVGMQKTRIERARELPIPIELSKDQVTRAPADVRFARETAKDPVLGGELQTKYADDNAKIQANLDKFVFDTGAEFSGVAPGELGQMLFNTVAPAKKARYAEIQNSYDVARNAGEMNELLPIKPLKDFVTTNYSAAENATVLKSLNKEIKRLAKGGEVSINDLEEIRKMVGVLAQSSGADSFYGKKAIKLMDNMTEGKGGDLYKNARALNTAYMKEFENTPALSQITAMKKGGQERVVAIESLLDKTLFQGPGERVKQLFGSLEKMGPEGQKMTQELRGAVAQKIKDEATKGVTKDINGRSYVSTQALNKIITDLDKSGKLEFIFGKKGAEQYRTLNEVTKDLQTVPVGTTNPSGTASSLVALATEMGLQGAMTGVPIPLANIGKFLYNKRQTKNQLNKVNEFVNYGKEQK